MLRIFLKIPIKKFWRKIKTFFILLFNLGAPTPEKEKEKEETNGNGVKETNGVDAKKEDTEESKDEEEKKEKENGKKTYNIYSCNKITDCT